MNEEALRQIVRETLAKRLASPAEHGTAPSAPNVLGLTSHSSHFRYALPGSGEACLIEPAVQCNHCGYCQSHGH
jgi:hypothetical protein